MTWIEPIFDRNSEDLAFGKNLMLLGWPNLNEEQKTRWLAGLRSSFNAMDANRIENNCKFISDIYGGLPGMTFKTNWTMSDILTFSDVQRILGNVAKLRDFCRIYKDTPKTPELPINTIEKLNDLEKILYDINYIFQNETLAFARNDAAYGAEIYCGDEIGDI